MQSRKTRDDQIAGNVGRQIFSREVDVEHVVTCKI